MLRNKLAVTVMGVAVISLAAGGGAGYWIAHQKYNPQSGPQQAAKVLYWYDPMKPEQHFDKPGKSPFMDMQLVPKYADENTTMTEDSYPAVKIDPSLQQNLAIRYASVEQAVMGNTLLTNGILQTNERQVAILQTRASGFVQRVYGHAVGDMVTQGSPIADISIPEWTGEQTEFLAVLRTRDRSLQASRQRLQLLGIPQNVINQVERTHRVQSNMTLSAPVSGFIDSLEVRNGMALAMGQTLVTIKGISPIWLEASVPEAQIAGIKRGMKVEATFVAYSQIVSGKVIDILPTLDSTSRTIKVRIELPNREGLLKPGMFASVKFSNNPQSNLVIPEQAVIRTGTRNVVIVGHEQGRFEPVVVQLGQSDGNKIAILKGLKAGQKVVISGQFLIDSEANLQGVLDKLNTGQSKTSSQVVKTSIYQGIGKVEKVTAQDITISHQAIPELGWGAMTMSFKQPVQPFTQIQQGDQVRFSFTHARDTYVISDISKMSMTSMKN
ncbi:efflux RND transporter periplasmic adaptor subunit [Acinetobacter pittii]